MSHPKRAPVQAELVDRKRGTPGRPSGSIAWTEHMEAFAAYAKRYGTGQSAERLAERGGFGWDELVALLGHEPRTWERR